MSNQSPLAADSISSNDDATCPIDETLKDYPFHFNRRYHKFKEGSYPFPNDDEEQERMDKQFNLIKQAQGGRLFFAPVHDARNVLDVGTGTGIWCITLADCGYFPNARITGIDLSPAQDGHPMCPRNVHFELQDCTDPDWLRPAGSLDFIYAQSLFGSLQDYAKYLITARKYLTPGTGWIECCETDIMPRSDDGSMPGAESESDEDDDRAQNNYRRTARGGGQSRPWNSTQPQAPVYAYREWVKQIDCASRQQGRPLRIAKQVKKWMLAAGYVEVQMVITKIPIGSWPKDKRLKAIGKRWADLIDETLPAASYKTFSDAFGMNRVQIEVFLAEVRKSLADRSVHAYLKNYTVYGRRPSADEETAMRRMAPPPLPNNIPRSFPQQRGIT